MELGDDSVGSVLAANNGLDFVSPAPWVFVSVNGLSHDGRILSGCR